MSDEAITQPTPTHIPTITEIDFDQLQSEIDAIQIRRLRVYTHVQATEAARHRSSNASVQDKADKVLAKFMKDFDKLAALIDKVETDVRKLRILQLELEAD